MVKVNFQGQTNIKDAKHFSYNFIAKNTGDVLNIMLKLTANKNNDIEFE